METGKHGASCRKLEDLAGRGHREEKAPGPHLIIQCPDMQAEHRSRSHQSGKIFINESVTYKLVAIV